MFKEYYYTQNKYFKLLAETFLDFLQDNIKSEAKLCFLGGGKSPVLLNNTIVKHPKSKVLENFLFIPSDERLVSKNDNLSNGKVMMDTLIQPLGLKENCKIFNLEQKDSVELCLESNRTHFGEELQMPVLLSLLGLGSDGHTAALFPGSGLEYGAPIVYGGVGPEGKNRVSFGIEKLSSAKEVWFIVNSKDKEKAFYQAASGAKPDSPLYKIVKRAKKTRIFLLAKEASIN